MFVIFVSHQWLGGAHPDPQGRQCAVLRTALQGMMDGSFKIESDPVTVMNRSTTFSSDECQQIADGFLFFDWFAIPQITARLEGVNEDETRSDAALAVQSIPAYVEVSNLFIALVPELTHTVTGARCNYISWLSRGWCRAELWCHVLSDKRNTSLVVVFSTTEAEYMFPLDWQLNAIADGAFTVESDRAAVIRLGELAVRAKIEHLSSAGPLSSYRFYLANRAQLLGQKKTWDADAFLEEFRFSSFEAAAKDSSSMNGIMCAIFASDVDLIRSLVKSEADVNFRVHGLDHFGYFDSQTLLMAAAKSHQPAEVLSALIELKGDVNMQAANGASTVFMMRSPEQVRTVVAARAELHKGGLPLELTPLTGVASWANVETVSSMLESRCDPNPELRGIGYGPLHGIAFFSRSNRYAKEIAALLISHRADVNRRVRPRNRYCFLCAVARAECAFNGFGASSLMTRVFASMPGITPLGMAALVGAESMTNLLLESGAEPMANDRGDTPEDLAAANQHFHVLQSLATFSV